MNNDRDKWNAKYRDRSDDPPSPGSFIERHADRLVRPTVLDIACGDGGNALFLAEEGFEVTGVDISEVALESLRRFAHERALDVETLRRDLDEPDAFAGCGRFDSVVVARFKPPEHLWAQIEDILRPGGVLLVCTFTVRQYVEHGFPRRFCLEPGELVDVSDALECLHREEYGGPESYSEGYVFRRI